jgi:hypothetical protein
LIPVSRNSANLVCNRNIAFRATVALQLIVTLVVIVIIIYIAAHPKKANCALHCVSVINYRAPCCSVSLGSIQCG